MADETQQFAQQAQEATRSMYETVQGMAQMQLNVLQRLGEVQRDQFRQAAETANTQMQLISKIRDPREFARAQADLVKASGQKYVDTINQTVEVMTQAWQEYADRLEKTADTATDKAQQTTSSKKP
jgi:hypothetical protein